MLKDLARSDFGGHTRVLRQHELSWIGQVVLHHPVKPFGQHGKDHFEQAALAPSIFYFFGNVFHAARGIVAQVLRVDLDHPGQRIKLRVVELGIDAIRSTPFDEQPEGVAS